MRHSITRAPSPLFVLSEPQQRQLAAIRSQMIKGPISQKALREGFDWGALPKRYRRLYAAQGGICPYCRTYLPLVHCRGGGKPANGCSIDHVRPRHEGNARWHNILIVHYACNHAKGGEGPTWEQMAFLRRAWALIDPWNRISADSVEGELPEDCDVPL